MRKLVLAGAFTALASLPVVAQATAYTQLNIAAGNDVLPQQTYFVSLEDGFGAQGQNSEISGVFNFATGTGPMMLTGTATGFADNGVLKTGVSATLENIGYSDSPYVTSPSYDVDPDGTPTWFDLTSFAFFGDTVSVVGSVAVRSIVFNIAVDGELDGGGWQPLVFLNQLDGDGGFLSTLYTKQSSGLVDTLVTTLAIPVIAGSAEFLFRLDSELLANTLWYNGGDMISGNVNFMNTVTITGVSGFDEFGQQVELTSVTGSGGYEFDVVNPGGSVVPEPAAWAQMIAGFGLAGFALRQARRTRRMRAIAA